MMSTKFPKLFPGMKLSRDVAYIEILLSPAANLREPRVRHKTAAVELLGDSPVRPAFGVPPSRGNKNTMGTAAPRQIKGSGPPPSQSRPSPGRLTCEGGRDHRPQRATSGTLWRAFPAGAPDNDQATGRLHRHLSSAGLHERRAPSSSRPRRAAAAPSRGWPIP